MAIDAKTVRELRELTGAGMMDCKKALDETGGDMDAAVDFLRKKGLKSAEKKASREMGEGRVYAVVTEDGRNGAIVAVTCETDFVAKTPDFEQFLEKLTDHVITHQTPDVEQLLGQEWVDGGTVELALKGLVGRLGENMSIAACGHLSNPKGQVGRYIHHDNKKGAIVSVSTDSDRAAAEEVLKTACQHIVVFSPPFVAREEIPAAQVEREKAVYREQVVDKPAEIQDKIIGGKLEKFYADNVFPEQPWVMDDKTTVAKALVAELGAGTSVAAFRHCQVGG